MTVATTDNRVSYTGNGVTTAFSYPYPVQAAADLVVVETVIATGVDTVKALTTHYTVSIASGGGSATVTAVTAPASTVRWTIYRDPALTQETDWVENDPDPAEIKEAAFDKLTMIAQRTRELVTRSIRQPEGDTADIGALPAKVARLGKFLYFNATTGDPEAAAGTTEVPVSAFMETVLDDADAATARGTLGIDTDMADGTAAAPGLPFQSDPDTGIFRPAADELGFAVGGAEAARFKSVSDFRLPGGANVTRRVSLLGSASAYSLGVSGGAAVAFIQDGSNNQELAFETHESGVSHAEVLRFTKERHARLRNSGQLVGRNAAGTADIRLARTDGSNNALLGEITGGTFLQGDNRSIRTNTIPAMRRWSGYGITLGSTFATVAHGLGSNVYQVLAVLRCTTADLGYSVGESISAPSIVTSGSDGGLSVHWDGTNFYLTANGSGIVIVRKDTKAVAYLTAASWVVDVVVLDLN